MPLLADAPTDIQAPVTHLLPVAEPERRPRSRQLWGLGLVCAYAGAAAWVAVCVKVILAAWG